MPCSYIYRRGKNAGIACGRAKRCSGPFCANHSKTVLQVQNLPTHVMATIVNAIRDDTHLKMFVRLLCLRATCKEYLELVDEKLVHLYAELSVPKEQETQMAGFTTKQKLHLLLESGCQRCKAPRITKIHWPFPFRVCTACIDKIMVRDYELKNEYGIERPVDRYLVRESWNRYGGISTYRLFLTQDVEKSIGCTLAAYKASEDTRSLQHKTNMVNQFGHDLDISKVTALSHIFKSSKFPIFADVERDLFYKMARNAFVYSYKQTAHFSQEYVILRSVNSKLGYESWMAYLHDNADMLSDKLVHQQYDEYKEKIRLDLVKLLRKNVYFSNTTLEQAVPDFFTRTNDTIGDLKDDTSSFINQVDWFVSNNALKKSDIAFDKISTMLLKRLVRYPAKEPECVRTFMRLYFESKYGFRWVNKAICNVDTWPEAIVVMKEYKLPI